MPTYTLVYDDARSTDLFEERVEATTFSEARSFAEARLAERPDVLRIVVMHRSVEVGAVWRRH